MVSLGGKELDITLFEKIIFNNSAISIEAATLKEVGNSHDFLKSHVNGRLIYGINTGFGPMAPYLISDEDRIQLQYNLIRSHASGMGSLLSAQETRATMVARLNTLLLACSGVHQDTVTLLTSLINHEAYPCIYAHGGVGASGDLVQLAHLALGLIGEGDFWYKGEITTAEKVFNALNIQPLQIHYREGLALLNGTSAMTGIGTINIIMAHRLVKWSVLASLMMNEIAEAYDDPFSEELNIVKLHAGQRQVAQWMRTLGKDSQLLKKRREHLVENIIDNDVIQDKVQEFYSLRCVPQVLGPIYDTVNYANNVIVNELNSVNDNPVVDYKNRNIFHGGNFHGDYTALEMDKLKIAVTKLSMLSERQLNYLLNPALNQILPPFINAAKLGLNFGLQGMQYPATSTVAENQSLSHPLYIHSIPNNNDNQDIVSMGCNAAVMCRRVIDNTIEVITIQLIALAQAAEVRGITAKLAPATQWLHREVRKIFPYITSDVAPYQDMHRVKTWVANTDIAVHFGRQ